MKIFSLTVSSFASTSFSYCFSLLSRFLFSKPFPDNSMHYEVIDHHSSVFVVEMQLKKENLKIVFWAPEFGCPTFSQAAWIRHLFFFSSSLFIPLLFLLLFMLSLFLLLLLLLLLLLFKFLSLLCYYNYIAMIINLLSHYV